MAVHFGQHAIGGAQVAGPRWWQARAVGVGLDHHGLPDLACLNSGGCSHELWIETAHETELQQHALLAGHLHDGIAFPQVERHGLFQEDVLLLGGRRP